MQADVPCATTLEAATAEVKAIEALRDEDMQVQSLQEPMIMTEAVGTRSIEQRAPSAKRQLDPTPLRIHHLMVWMTVTAALISMSMWFDRTARNGPPITDRIVIASLIVGAIALSAALTCFGFGVCWRRAGHEFPLQPGDLLIVIAAKSAMFFVAIIAGIVVIFFTFGDDDWQPAYIFFSSVLAVIGWVRINARGYARHADSAAWRIVYPMMNIAPAITLLMTLFGIWSVAPLIALIACLIGAAGSDLRNHLQRRWTHWLGTFVAVLLIASLIGLFGR